MQLSKKHCSTVALTMLIAAWATSRCLARPPGAETSENMARVPGGTFAMGDHYGVGWKDELPVHRLTIDGFFMDRKEVSNRDVCRVFQWALDHGHIKATSATVRSNGSKPRELIDLDDWNCQLRYDGGRFSIAKGKESHPCIEITWFGAVAYCNFRSTIGNLKPCYKVSDWSCDFLASGYRLPTEAEWERAARGGLEGHHFPWPGKGGDYRDHGDGSHANFWMSGDPYEKAEGYVKSSPVGYFDGNQTPGGKNMANGYGLYDMAGNVWEWCWDRYRDDWYSQNGASKPNTTGPSEGEKRLLRGGSWESGSKDAATQYSRRGPVYHLRCANRASGEPERGRHNRGFRCVRRQKL